MVVEIFLSASFVSLSLLAPDSDPGPGGVSALQ
jgi:hypothetical protein